MTVCSDCGSQQPDDARFCNGCGASMASSMCSACGEPVVPGARFCNSCGAPTEATTCSACGEPLSPGARFCHECGAAQQPGTRAGVRGTAVSPKPRSAASAAVSSGPVAARRVTSVLFGDLVGFTSLSESRDQEEVRELLSRYFEECRQIIGRYGGTVEKFIGDAVMAVWGVPAAHEDDAERSVRAGLELVNAVGALGEELGVAELAMRVGIVTGEVAVTIGAEAQGMVAGDAVNTASRVQSVASPGQVWVDETTRLLTSLAITYVDVGSHALKGKVEPVPLWAVRAVVAARGGAQRADGLEAPLVGRGRELRLVKELFHATEESGRPALVVLDGDPGVGKSRLAWEFEKYVDGLSTEVRWHGGRCLAYGEGVAFYALAEAVRGRLAAEVSLGTDAEGPDSGGEQDSEPTTERLLDLGLKRHVSDVEERAWMRPRLAGLLGTEAVGSFAREDLFTAWVTFLERVGGGQETVVLVVDDAQHADEGLLAFVEHLLKVASFPCFVVLVTRPELLEDRPGLATNRRSTVVHLPTLPDADVAELVDGLVAGLPARLRDGLVQRTEGIPLYAVETVRSLIDRDVVVPRGGQYVLADDAGNLDLDAIGAPATLQALVSARLDTLSPAQRRVVDKACVLGGFFGREDLAALCPELADRGELERVLAELVRLQMLQQETSRLSAEVGRYSFVQAVVRQVAYSTLSRRDRKATHLAVAQLLEQEAASSEDVVPVLAQHYLDALAAVPGDEDSEVLRNRAVEQLRRAADRALALGAPGEAAGHLDAAYEQAADPAQRAQIASDLAEAMFHTGRYHEGAEHAQEATQVFDQLGDEVAAALAVARQARILGSGLGEPEAALQMARPRWEALQDRTDADQARLLLGLALGNAENMTGDSGDFGPVSTETLRIAQRLGAGEAIADCLTLMGIHYGTDGLMSLSRPLLEAAANLARSERRPLSLARVLVNLNAFSTPENITAAVHYGREAVEVAQTTGTSFVIAGARVNLCLALVEDGSWDEVTFQCQEVGSGASPMDAPVVSALTWRVASARGEPWKLSWEVGSLDPVDDPLIVAFRVLAEALSARAQRGVGAGVEGALDATQKMLGASGHGDDFHYVWAEAAERVLEAEDRDAWARLSELAGGERDLFPLALQAHRTRFHALWRMRTQPGSPEVEDGLRRAIELYQRWGSTVRAAQARADLGVWLVGRGRGDEAAGWLEQARTTYEQLGASAWLADLDQRLGRVGASRH